MERLTFGNGPDMQDKLVILYEQMSELTKPECGSCRAPHSCCAEMYCSLAKELASERGVTLPEYPPNYKGAFYLNRNSCTVPPHLRPLCTLHTCAISGFGFKPGDEQWTKKYFSLRNEIDKLELTREETP